MANLVFSIKLKEEPVKITGKDGTEKIYKLKELTGDQRKQHDANFDYKIEAVGDTLKAVPGENFKVLSSAEFLALCFYDEKNVLVSFNVLGGYPYSMLDQLHKAALKLSGMDKDSLEAAKNESEGSKGSGSE